MGNHSQGIVTFCIMEAQDVRSKTKRRMGLRSGPLSCIGRNYITDSTLEKFYSPSGPLSRMPGYEFRPQQLELALAVQEFLRDPLERTFAAEAPPGVGKTFALLVPALREAAGERRILFLTAGIALQEQLIGKDLPRLKGLLGRDFSFGLLKGRSHYACLRKGAALLSSGVPELSPSLFAEADGALSDVPGWLAETETGDLSELNAGGDHPVLVRLTAGGRGCIGTSCPYRSRCFVIRAYRSAQDWDVVVANYHLFFSHILEGGGAFPVRYDWLICDEAHRMPDVARSASAIRAGADGLASILSPRVLQGFDALLRAHSVEPSEVREEAGRCRSALRALFDAVRLRMPRDGGLSSCDPDLLRLGRVLTDGLDRELHALRGIEDRFMAGDFSDPSALAEGAELMNWIDDVRSFKKSLLWCLEVGRFPGWAYWGDGESLTSMPVAAAEIVRDVLEREDPEKIVLSSATLTLSGDFSFWSGESGIIPDRTLAVPSPFDFARQMEIWVVDVGLPVGGEGYDDTMCRVMKKLCDGNGGRTLVLLSSLRLLRAFARRMREGGGGYTVLVQGELPQRELLARFREDETSVLIGSVSFREGVDVPGEGLTQVIVDRIPFPHPGDPLVRARNELEEGKGFVRVTLPNARMFLRQAVGRLIRSSSDHGRVVLLDGRAVERRDWRVLESLPSCRCTRLSLREGNGSLLREP